MIMIFMNLFILLSHISRVIISRDISVSIEKLCFNCYPFTCTVRSFWQCLSTLDFFLSKFSKFLEGHCRRATKKRKKSIQKLNISAFLWIFHYFPIMPAKTLEYKCPKLSQSQSQPMARGLDMSMWFEP